MSVNHWIVQKSFNYFKSKDVLLTLTQMFHKDFWESKVRTEFMEKRKIHSTPNALQVDLQEDKALKLQLKLQPSEFVLTLLDQLESQQLFVVFMVSNQLEVKDSQ